MLGQHLGPPDLGRLRRHPRPPTSASSQAAAGPDNTPYSGAPLNQLYVRQLSRDRNINDITLENQTEVDGQVRHRPDRPSAADGHSTSTTSSYTNKTSTRTGSCNGIPLVAGSVGCTPAGFTVGAGTPGNVAVDSGQLRVVAGLGLRRLFQRHDPGDALAEAGRRRCAGTSIRRRSATRSTRPTRPATPRCPTQSRPTTSPASAPARSSSRRRSSPTTSRTAPRSIRRSSSSPRRPASTAAAAGERTRLSRPAPSTSS